MIFLFDTGEWTLERVSSLTFTECFRFSSEGRCEGYSNESFEELINVPSADILSELVYRHYIRVFTESGVISSSGDRILTVTSTGSATIENVVIPPTITGL